MRQRPRTSAARLAAAFTGALLVGAVPAAVGADSTAPDAAAGALRAQSSSLGARADAATLELYALETELGRARFELAALQAQHAELTRQQESAREQLTAARQAVRSSGTRLARLVRALYEQGGPDPLAVVLGARSLEEALAGLDGLDRAALQSSRILEQARDARGRLAAASAGLAARHAELARAAAAAERRAAALAATASARRAFIAGLRRQQGLNEARIASIQARARSAERRTAALTTSAGSAATAAQEAAPAPEPVALSVDQAGERTLTVATTGYSIQGRTATGIRTAPGVVAVDPSLIPLGTRMTIPGYGAGIAADTGGSVQGATIDLWFATEAEALAWGRRTVTITLR